MKGELLMSERHPRRRVAAAVALATLLVSVPSLYAAPANGGNHRAQGAKQAQATTANAAPSAATAKSIMEFILQLLQMDSGIGMDGNGAHFQADSGIGMDGNGPH
jgi:hypothetical protein